MEIFIGNQVQAAAYSFILGLIFGGLYDIIRIVHILCGIASYSGEKRGMKRGIVPFLLFFLCDAVYALVVTAAFSVFLYWQMSGVFRWFILASAAAGFAVYYHTAGRIVMAFSEAIVRFLRLAALWVIVKPVRLILRLLRKMFGFLYRQTVGRIISGICRTARMTKAARIRKKLREDICGTVQRIK